MATYMHEICDQMGMAGGGGPVEGRLKVFVGIIDLPVRAGEHF